jgi:hypothetical protein
VVLVGLLALQSGSLRLIAWIVPIVLFLALLIAAAIGIDASKYGAYDAMDGRLYNESDGIKDYVDGYLAYRARQMSGQGTKRLTHVSELHNASRPLACERSRAASWLPREPPRRVHADDAAWAHCFRPDSPERLAAQ